MLQHKFRNQQNSDSEKLEVISETVDIQGFVLYINFHTSYSINDSLLDNKRSYK